DVSSGERHVVVERAWDAAVSYDGSVLFYVSLDERSRPRLYARRLADGRAVAITDGAYIEGMPRTARGAAPTRIVFTRWVDDQNADGAADADDLPSLWTTTFDPSVFAGAPPGLAKPLTAGQGGEIFASVVSDFFVYTSGGRADLDIYALPADGVMSQGAGPDVVFQAARSENNTDLRRLAWRYLIAVSPQHEAKARYELARELGERERYSDAVEELGRVVAAAQDDSLARVARIESERLRLLARLRGRLLVREEAERRYVAERVEAAEQAAGDGSDRAVSSRLRVTLAEIDYALGRRGRAVQALESIAASPDVPAEDGARALNRLGEIYAGMRDVGAVARVSETVLRRFSSERHYVRQAAERWVESARSADGVPPGAAMQNLAQRSADLSAVAARAAVALANEQQRTDSAVALAEWQRIANQFTSEREILAEALSTLAAAADRQGADGEAIAAYERLVAEFPDNPKLRNLARRGISRIALRRAQSEERSGRIAEARASYARVVRNNPDVVIAHRRHILLSARLGKLDEVLSAYAAAAKADPRDKMARYGYGYALSFARPPDLDDVEREMQAALALDPRFAAAHLTLGWVRELKDRDAPKGGWLEKADGSYETARSLVDPATDAELWAAAKLNRGNVLFALGKTDDALLLLLLRQRRRRLLPRDRGENRTVLVPDQARPPHPQ
ncbi:MAG: tetratricopeptide repeat protein, partial [Deltaproteobacteria bacterium]|nr:tetratricopeptide repeat protein [Deltaproteobacteria bacterium]